MRTPGKVRVLMLVLMLVLVLMLELVLVWVLAYICQTMHHRCHAIAHEAVHPVQGALVALRHHVSMSHRLLVASLSDARMPLHSPGSSPNNVKFAGPT